MSCLVLQNQNQRETDLGFFLCAGAQAGTRRVKRSKMETRHERHLQRNDAPQKKGMRYPWRCFEGPLFEKVLHGRHCCLGIRLAWTIVRQGRRTVHLVVSAYA